MNRLQDAMPAIAGTASRLRLMSARVLVTVACIALLSACATRPVRPPLSPELQAAAEARQQAREQALRARDGWALQGRIAMSVDRNGGSGRIDWRQEGATYTVELSAPVTRQGWRLSGGPGGATLDGLEGGPRSGPDAVGLLYEATGWLIPVEALGDWVRGLRADGGGPAQVEYGPDGRLQRLAQDGWLIEYDWSEAAVAAATELPVRVDARRQAADGPQARVKLVVDNWLDADGGGSADGAGGR